MESGSGEAAVEEAVRLTIDGHAPMIAKWIAGEPKSWGFLAGKAVTACRHRLGRSLTDLERRKVWQLLWNRLAQLKQSRANDS